MRFCMRVQWCLAGPPSSGHEFLPTARGPSHAGSPGFATLRLRSSPEPTRLCFASDPRADQHSGGRPIVRLNVTFSGTARRAWHARGLAVLAAATLPILAACGALDPETNRAYDPGVGVNSREGS